MLGLLDVHWSLKSDKINSWISTYVQMIKSRFIAFKLFIVMQLWDKCYINLKKINEITFQTTFRVIMSSSTITYTFVYTDSEPWRFQWVSDAELDAPDATPQSPGQTPPSLDDVLGPKHPPSLDYVAKSNPEEDLDKDPEKDHADYPADGGDDDDDESSDDNDDDAEDTEAFKIDESAPTPPRSPRLHRSKISVRLPPPMTASMKARIAEFASAPTPSFPPPSPLNDLPEVDMPLQKRARFTAPASEFEVEESSIATVAKQPVLDVATVDATPRHLCIERLAMGLRMFKVTWLGIWRRGYQPLLRA
nr:hypothetical protein [Tanacetum cinerariifolium]